jgi:hypothetical protein
MEPEGSLRGSQEPSTGPYHKPAQSNPYQFRKIHSNVFQNKTLSPFIQNKALHYTWNNLFVLSENLTLAVLRLINSPLIFLFKPEEVDYVCI